MACDHSLIPVFAPDPRSASRCGGRQCTGWECIFCNEHFDTYVAYKKSTEAARAEPEGSQLVLFAS